MLTVFKKMLEFDSMSVKKKLMTMDFGNFTDVCGRHKTMLADFLAAVYKLLYSPTYLCLHILQFYR